MVVIERANKRAKKLEKRNETQRKRQRVGGERIN